MNESQGQTLRNRILDGAVALFIEKGIENVTTRELTQFVGISRSHIYHYFPDWRALSLEAIERFMQQDLDNFKEEIAGLQADAALEAFIAGHLPQTHEADTQLYNAVWTQAAHDEGFANIAVNILNSWSKLIESVVTEGIQQGVYRETDPIRITRIIGAAVNGYADILSVKPSPERCHEAKEDLRYLVDCLLATPHRK